MRGEPYMPFDAENISATALLISGCAVRNGRPAASLRPAGGVRLGGQQPGVQVSGFPAAARRPAQCGAAGSPALAEQQVIRLALDHLAGLEPERLGARAHHRPGGSPPLSLAWM